MSLPQLPNELFTQILDLISFSDQQTCMHVCKAWWIRFRTFILKSVHLKTRRQFKPFFSNLAKSHDTPHSLGILIHRLLLGPQVGVSALEFKMLPIYCPYTRYLDFNPRLWQYMSNPQSIIQWQYLARFPSISRPRLAFPILAKLGQTLSQLELHTITMDQDATHQIPLTSALVYTPNLKSLKLTDDRVAPQNLSIPEFETIHILCPKIESLLLDGFHGHLMSSDSYLIDIDTLPIASRLKTLHLRMSINSGEFLRYWGHKYPNLEGLSLQLRLLEPEYFHEDFQPIRMTENFRGMASQYGRLKMLRARFDEKHFPSSMFLRGLNSAREIQQLQEISIKFFNFDYHRQSAHHLKILISHSLSTITSIEISHWGRNWDYESDILNPLSQCNQLVELSLSPQPGTLTEFDIDIILDRCSRLRRLGLAHTYNLFVRNDASLGPHPLEILTLRYTMVNDRLFDYLGIRCPAFHTLDISHVTKPYDNSIQVKINMPRHDLRSVRIEKLQLGLRIEDAGFQCGRCSTLCSIEETAKVESRLSRSGSHKERARWYHLYQNYRHRPYIKEHAPRLQRLDPVAVEKIKNVHVTRQLWRQISFAGARIRYENKKNWALDIPFGIFSVRCRSVHNFVFEGVRL